MSLWLFLVPSMLILVAIARIWTMVRDMRAGRKEISQPAGRVLTSSESLTAQGHLTELEKNEIFSLLVAKGESGFFAGRDAMLAMELQEEFEITIPDEEAEKIKTV